MKKTLSILLTFILIFSSVSLCFAAVAADEKNIVLSGEALDEAIVAAAAELADVPSDAVLLVDSADEKEAVKAGDLAKEFAKFVFVDLSKVGDYADKIAEDAEYTVVTLENGKKTVYVSVDFRKNPELANLDVFRESVKKINEKQKAVAGEGDYSLMSYQHIAGELALHAILAAGCSAFGVSEDNSTFKKAIVADLNIDESRFPTSIIKLIGTVLMDYIVTTFYTIFKSFSK